MTHSDDDDKTRIQSSNEHESDEHNRGEQNSAEHNDQSAEQSTSADGAHDQTVIAADAEQRRLIAEQKAREMEERLAQLSGSHSDETQIAAPSPDEQDDDRTRIAGASL